MDVIVKISHGELLDLGMTRGELSSVIGKALDKAETYQGAAVVLDHVVNVEFSDE